MVSFQSIGFIIIGLKLLFLTITNYLDACSMNELQESHLNQKLSHVELQEKEQQAFFSRSKLVSLEENIPQEYDAGEIDKLTYVFRRIADQQINCVIRYSGHFSLPRFRHAVALTFYAEPVLGCRFVPTNDRAYWRRRDDLADKQLCLFEETDDIEQAIESFITAPCDPTEHIPLQVALFRYEDGDVLCLKVSHVVLDGGGIQDYLSLLQRFYKRLEVDPAFLPEPNVSGRRDLKQVFEQLGFFKRIGVFLQYRSRKPTWAFPWKSTNACTRKFTLRRFLPDAFKALKEYSKKVKVTITDLIVTAFYRAMARITDIPLGEKMLGTLSVNLRPYMPNSQATSLCNLTASSHTKASVDSQESFKETLQKIHRSTQKMKRKGPGLEAALFCRLLFNMKFGKAKTILNKTLDDQLDLEATYPVITNIGLVEKENINFNGEVEVDDCYIVTPFMKAPGFLMGVITVGQTMVLSMGYFEESYDSSVVEQFLDYMVEELTIKR
ncbi:MAG: hypothetical protein U9O98_02405 [Asgard group archaeon]|nr:hypothetical protein [Asgard group archaeon]